MATKPVQESGTHREGGNDLKQAILAALARGAVSANRLWRRLRVPRPACQAACRALEAEHLVVRVGQKWALPATSKALAANLVDFANQMPELFAASWGEWKNVLARIVRATNSEGQVPTKELWVVAGRGCGKSRIIALIAVYFASQLTWNRVAGEKIYVGIFAPSRDQAQITLGYIGGFLESHDALRMLVDRKRTTMDSIHLKTGVVIEVITASPAAPRGRSYALAIIEEAAHLSSDVKSARPDTELLRAVRPALARVPGSLLCVISSPAGQRGILWSAYQQHHGKPDGRVVFVQATTQELNPSFDAEAIAAAYEDDPEGAAAEFGAEFRSNSSSFVTLEAVTACVQHGRREIAPRPNTTYRAFVDPSGGRSDSFTICIGHQATGDDDAPVAVIDCIREVKPPLNPDAVVKEFVALLKTYGIESVCGDRYAGAWVSESFARHGITYNVSEQPKNAIYAGALALINSRRVEFLDHSALVTQLTRLKRSAGSSGKTIVDHETRDHDDIANVVCGCAVLLTNGEDLEGEILLGFSLDPQFNPQLRYPAPVEPRKPQPTDDDEPVPTMAHVSDREQVRADVQRMFEQERRGSVPSTRDRADLARMKEDE